MLSALQISKSFAGTTVLGPLDVNFQTGLTTVLLGLSGCGKSTLLRLLMGLTEPDSGAVIVNGTKLTLANCRLLRQKIGYVTQDGGLFPHLTAMENIMLAAKYFHRKAEAQNNLEKLLRMTKISSDLLDHYPAELSGGQRQRVSLVRALILNPEIVLLDEPMAALDPMIRADLQADLKSIFANLHKTVVLVTHDVAEAAFLGDQIIMMNAGKILQEGTFEMLLHRPSDPFVTAFLAAQRPVVWQSVLAKSREESL